MTKPQITDMNVGEMRAYADTLLQDAVNSPFTADAANLALIATALYSRATFTLNRVTATANLDSVTVRQLTDSDRG